MNLDFKFRLIYFLFQNHAFDRKFDSLKFAVNRFTGSI